MGTELDDKGYALVKKALETSIKMIAELQEDRAKLQSQRENYMLKQPPLPEKLRFSVGEICEWIEESSGLNADTVHGLIEHGIKCPLNGIKAFTERRQKNE
jgi:hypothetical protein